jgi:SAM-dependent methyltransferase
VAVKRGPLGVVVHERVRHAEEARREYGDIVAMFREQLLRESWRGRTVLDAGTGEGRLAFFLAPRAARVVGVDIDRRRIQRAREYASLKRITNVEFHVGDVERTPYHVFSPYPLDAVVANFCMSDAVVHRAARALDVGGTLAFCAHHSDHWRETGEGSGYAFSEIAMMDLLTETRFQIAFMGVERHVVLFDGLADAARFVGERRVARWVADGRWHGLRQSFAAGERHLTLSYLVVKARRVPFLPEGEA